MVFKKARLGRDYNMGALNPSPTHHAIHSYKAIQYIVKIEYKANNIGRITSGAGVAEPHNPPPGKQAVRITSGAGVAEPHSPLHLESRLSRV